MIDLREGLRYHFPLCCILFYVLVYRHIHTRIYWYFKRFCLRDRDYIPCPFCALLGIGRGKDHKL